jgi:mTERF domain-containing protein
MVLPMPNDLRNNSLTNKLQVPLPPPLNSNAKPTDQKPNFITPSKKPFVKQSSSLHPNSYELNSHPKHIDSRPLKPLDSKSYSPKLGFDIDALDLEFSKKLVYLDLIEVDISRAIRHNPLILSTSFRSVEKIVGFLQQWGMLHKDLRRIFGMCPQLLTCNVDKDLVPILDFLLFEVKILRKDIRKCINRCPRILSSSVMEQLRPT